MNPSLSTQRSPAVLLLVIVLLSFGSALFSAYVFFLLGAKVWGVDLSAFSYSIVYESPQPAYQYLLLISQGLGGAFSLIVVPLIFIRRYEKQSIQYYFNTNHLHTLPLFIALGLTLAVMALVSPVVVWNMEIDLPSAIKGWLDSMEANRQQFTDYITHFHSLVYFLFAFLVVAIVPAVGEELLFRGLIQKYMQRIFRNPHAGIWVTALLFSAFHLQFYGLAPRLLLGAFLGYLFYFSGNLTYAIVGHALNNSLTLLLMYLFQIHMIDFDVEKPEATPLWVVGLALLAANRALPLV